MSLADPFFWTALLKIIGVNIVLSGDNAVVIAISAPLVIYGTASWTENLKCLVAVPAAAMVVVLGQWLARRAAGCPAATPQHQAR